MKTETKKWNVTAEHCNGASVGHPCTTGVFEDPANTFEETVEAETETQAIAAGCELLKRVVAAYEPCACRRHRQPGSYAWWNSVAIHAEPVAN